MLHILSFVFYFQIQMFFTKLFYYYFEYEFYYTVEIASKLVINHLKNFPILNVWISKLTYGIQNSCMDTRIVFQGAQAGCF